MQTLVVQGGGNSTGNCSDEVQSHGVSALETSRGFFSLPIQTDLGILHYNLSSVLDPIHKPLGGSVTKCLNRHLLLTGLEAEGPKVKVQADKVPGDSPPPGSQTAAFPLSSKYEREREREGASSRTLTPSLTSSKPNYPQRIHLRI